jgi:hypothetical protein
LQQSLRIPVEEGSPADCFTSALRVKLAQLLGSGAFWHLPSITARVTTSEKRMMPMVAMQAIKTVTATDERYTPRSSTSKYAFPNPYLLPNTAQPNSNQLLFLILKIAQTSKNIERQCRGELHTGAASADKEGICGVGSAVEQRLSPGFEAIVGAIAEGPGQG